MNLVRKTKLPLLLIIGLLTVLFISSTVSSYIAKKNQAQEDNKQQHIADSLFDQSEYDFRVGNPQSRVHLVVYVDTDCPYCKELESSLTTLLDRHGNEVSITYRHYKLPIYPYSQYEHLALECVGILAGPYAYRSFQNEVLYETSLANESDPKLKVIELATQYLGDNFATPVSKCISDPSTEERVSRKVNTASVLGIRQTPTWFVITESGERKRYVGNVSYQRLIWLINTTLAEKRLTGT